MCARLDAVRQMKQCADELHRACAPLSKLYQQALEEPLPDYMKELLAKLK